MIDREKVIRAIEAHMGGIQCDRCPYKEDCDFTEEMPAVLGDALALLKEQEARVMTVDEVRDNCFYMWAEFFSPTAERECLIFCGVGQNQDYEECADLYKDSGVVSWQIKWDNYGRTWRCWTARPTEEQRKAAKWDD